MTWLGFAEPTEHQARQSEVEQSALTLKSGNAPAQPDAPAPMSDAQPLTRPEAAAPAPEPSPTPAPPPPTVAQPPPEAAPSPVALEISEKEAEERRRAVSAVIAEVGQRVAEAFRDLAREPVPSTPAPLTTPSPTPVAQRPSSNAAARPPARPASPAAGAPGIQSDRESIAAALKNAPVVKPGQVVAAKGMEIRTRRPQWTNTTELTRSPRNPTVEITFGRDGKVRKAEFVAVGSHIYSTGFDDVDEPLLDAIYLWTAKGKPLDALPADKPDATVTVLITIVLS